MGKTDGPIQMRGDLSNSSMETDNPVNLSLANGLASWQVCHLHMATTDLEGCAKKQHDDSRHFKQTKWLEGNSRRLADRVSFPWSKHI